MPTTNNHNYTTLNSSSRPHSLSRRLIRLGLFAVLLPAVGLIILSLLAYLSPLRGVTRPCIPFSLTRVSFTAHQKLSCDSQGDTMAITQDEVINGDGVAQGNRLGDFLLSQKEAFLGDFNAGNLKGWTVVMGNEAGDLDSIASSVAFAYLSSALRADRVVPLILTPSSLMRLRQENLLAFKLANKLDPSVLLHPDLIPLGSSSPSALSKIGELGATFALVDHNKLLPQFGTGKVVAVLDHHEDERAHLDADPRIIAFPTGSCSSLIARHFAPQWQAATSGPARMSGSNIPREVATLLLTAGLIDTAGYKPEGKATSVDREAAAFLYPLSTLHDPNVSESLSASTQSSSFEEVFSWLIEAKQDVSGLNTNDLLLRDYKEYVLPTASEVYPTLRAGLSTVPVGIKKLLKREEDGWDAFLSELDLYMDQRELDIVGVLTSFNNKEGKHRREILLATKTGHAFKTAAEAERVMKELTEGFEKSDQLDLKDWEDNPVKKLVGRKAINDGKVGRFGKVWKQNNSKATRKQSAPLLRDLVAKLQ